MATHTLFSFAGGQVTLTGESDDVLLEMVALVATNDSDQPARLTFDRPVGDTINRRIPAHSSFRRDLTMRFPVFRVTGAVERFGMAWPAD